MGYNSIIVIGNLGADPELRYTKEGVAVASFNIAVSNGKDDKTTWFKITTWRNTAEASAKFLKKGSLVFVNGTLGVEEYVDKSSKNRFALTIQAKDVQFLNSDNNAPKKEISGANLSPDEEEIDDVF